MNRFGKFIPMLKESGHLRLTKSEIEEKISRLKERAKKSPEDSNDIKSEIDELQVALKSGKFKKD